MDAAFERGGAGRHRRKFVAARAIEGKSEVGNQGCRRANESGRFVDRSEVHSKLLAKTGWRICATAIDQLAVSRSCRLSKSVACGSGFRRQAIDGLQSMHRSPFQK